MVPQHGSQQPSSSTSSDGARLPLTDYQRWLALLHQAIDQRACEAVGVYGLFALTSALIPGKLMMKVINGTWKHCPRPIPAIHQWI